MQRHSDHALDVTCTTGTRRAPQDPAQPGPDKGMPNRKHRGYWYLGLMIVSILALIPLLVFGDPSHFIPWIDHGLTESYELLSQAQRYSQEWYPIGGEIYAFRPYDHIIYLPGLTALSCTGALVGGIGTGLNFGIRK